MLLYLSGKASVATPTQPSTEPLLTRTILPVILLRSARLSAKELGIAMLVWSLGLSASVATALITVLLLLLLVALLALGIARRYVVAQML